MLRLSLFLAAATLSTAATAQTVTVRSGEHDGFTRLVLDLPRALEHRLETDLGRLEVIFDQPSLQFDTSEVFDRISRDRVAEIGSASGSGKLEVDLGCACVAQEFWHLGRYLVIDIYGDEALIDRSTASETSPDLALPTLLSLGASVQGLSFGSGPAFAPAASVATVPAPKPETTLPPVRASRDALLASLEEQTLHREEISELERNLSESIGLAASQGLLQANTQNTPVEVPEPAPPSARAIETPDPEPEPLAPTVPQVHATSTAGTNLEEIADILNEENATRYCGDPDYFDLAEWGGDGDFLPQRAHLIANLFDSRGNLAHDNVLSLSRLFLHYGFGAEAKEAANLRKDETEALEIAKALSDVLEYQSKREIPSLARYRNCGSERTLWSVLGSYSTEPLDEDVEQSVVRAFARLPGPVQIATAAPLGERLAAAGHAQTAKAILRYLVRENEFTTESVDLVAVRLEASPHLSAEQQARLAEIAVGNSPEAADAMTEWLLRGLKKDATIAPEMIELAGVMIVENDGADVAVPLRKAFLRALLHNRSLDEALTNFDDMASEFSAEDYRTMLDAVMADMAEFGEVEPFLKRVLALNGEELDVLESSTSIALADRLVDLGLTNAALDILERPTLASSQERDMLAARAYLLEKRPGRVLDALAAYDDDAAREMRGRAYQIAGQHAEAIESLKDSEDTRDLVASAWELEDLALVGEVGETDEQALAEAVVAAQDVLPQPDAPLASGREIIDLSADLRARLTQYLSEE
ncbi:hypothetical protein [Poseidonocella sedimentorum]|uniref:HEAT repeat domain-containing protein n=1 Tax=Poseidonocella sedimentorum TaxID=871652 RepID=A0A1I6D5I6_9RHOB|nr:hypothetical protein [Poseidonocella sedimentorum]SFR00725.1 hypothetical protein SAMN04515673_102209 [Poseidonocella sedimentorum]